MIIKQKGELFGEAEVCYITYHSCWESDGFNALDLAKGVSYILI